MKARKQFPTLFFFLALGILFATGCVSAAETPPPTISAVVADSNLLSTVNPEEMTVLQDRGFGSGKIVLYQWEDNQGNRCLGTSYLIEIDQHWEMSDTATTPCQSEDSFIAAYTGNSETETQLGIGDPRQTVVYGTIPSGHVVQVVWVDGQVERIPLKNGSFLSVRPGRIGVERIELFDSNNRMIEIKNFVSENVSLSS